jgi:hypothetical protein
MKGNLLILPRPFLPSVISARRGDDRKGRWLAPLIPTNMILHGFDDPYQLCASTHPGRAEAAATDIGRRLH